MKSQKSQGLGFKSRLPGTRYLYWGLPWTGRKRVAGRDSPLVNPSRTIAASRPAACPVRSRSVQPFVVVGQRTAQADYQGRPPRPPSVLALSEISQIKRKTKAQMLFAAFLPQLHNLKEKTKLPSHS